MSRGGRFRALPASLPTHSITGPAPLWSALAQGPMWPPASSGSSHPPRASHSLPEAELGTNPSVPDPFPCLGASLGLQKPGVPIATGPDTTSLQQTAKSRLLYANNPVGPGRGLHPTPTQCRLGPGSVPACFPQPTPTLGEPAGSWTCLCAQLPPKGSGNAAAGMPTISGPPKSHPKAHTCSHPHTSPRAPHARPHSGVSPAPENGGGCPESPDRSLWWER